MTTLYVHTSLSEPRPATKEELVAAAMAAAHQALISAPYRVDGSGEAVEYLRKAAGMLDYEQFGVLFVRMSRDDEGEQHGYVIGSETFGLGSPTSVDVPVKRIIRRAMELGADGMCVWHNHPGQAKPTPSDPDIATTCKLAIMAATVDLTLYDHIVIGTNGAYYSMYKKGLFQTVLAPVIETLSRGLSDTTLQGVIAQRRADNGGTLEVSPLDRFMEAVRTVGSRDKKDVN